MAMYPVAPQVQSSAPDPNAFEMDQPVAPPFVGVNSGWRKILVQAEVVAPHLHLAVIEGESGSGKQTLARFLHSRSRLARSAFQRHDAREWLVTECDPVMIAGFLYLDRIDLLAGPGQGLLLSVLKALQDRPLGRAIIVGSSEVPLRHMAGQGRFIPDLAFRLTAVRFAVPPLRQRREDIAPLAHELLTRICAVYQQRPVTLGTGALARLLQHDWPGNVRELASVLEGALLEASDGTIRADDLVLTAEAPDTYVAPHSTGRIQNLSLDTVIRQHVEAVLELNHGNKLRAARQLGISRSTLYRILGNEPAVAP